MGAAPSASENKRDIQQWPVAVSHSLGKGIVESGCSAVAVKSFRTPPAAHTWAAPRPRACVRARTECLQCAPGASQGRSRRAQRGRPERLHRPWAARAPGLCSACCWRPSSRVSSTRRGNAPRPLPLSSLALSPQPRAQLSSVCSGRPGTQPWAGPGPGSGRGAPWPPLARPPRSEGVI